MIRFSFQSPFHRVKDCNRPRAALMNPSRMSKVSVFLEAFCVSSHQTSPRSSKKCISPTHLVLMPIRGAVIADFANRFLVLLYVRSLMAIRERRSQIQPPSPVSKAQCEANARLNPTKGTTSFCIEKRLKRLTSGSDTEQSTRIYVLPFFANLPRLLRKT